MFGRLPTNATRPSRGSWVDSWLSRRQRHPESFDCGVRVLAGELHGERARWQFRVSAVDPLTDAGAYVLHHGTQVTLRLRPDGDGIGSGPRQGHVSFAATEVVTSARVQVSVPLGELVRFGLA